MFQQLGSQVRKAQDELLAACVPDQQLRARLADRVTLREGMSSPRARWPIAVAAMILVVGALFVLIEPRQTHWRGGEQTVDEPELSFSLDGNPLATGEWVLAPKRAPASLRFSDGSELVLEPRARARVLAVTARGAEIVLEAGRAEVAVTARDGAAWRVRSGPFVVDVKGTRFGLGWDAGSDTFELSLFEGRVVVSGCGLEPQAVSAGQRASASCDRQRLSVRPLGEEQEASPVLTAEQADATSMASAPAPTATPRPRERRSPAVPEDSWAALAHAGRYREALGLARAAGFESLCENAAAETVLLLARTARLAGDPSAAGLAYRQVLARFSGSEAATRAVFGLGVLDASAGRPSAARSWFERYLERAPNGPMAEAALGRALESSVALGDTEAALRQARLYLRRYAHGPHARSAERLVGSENSGN